MTKSIETEIVRLIEEIAKDEKNIRYYRQEYNVRFTERMKQQALDEVKMYEESLERKMQLLRILKGAEV